MHKYYIINEMVEFHPAAGMLSHLHNPGKTVILNSPASRCLLLLIEHVGSIVTQQDFMDVIWAKRGMLVSTNAYYQNICILRKGLKKIGFTSDLIVTIPRIGLTLAVETKITVSYEASLPASPVAGMHTKSDGQILRVDSNPALYYTRYSPVDDGSKKSEHMCTSSEAPVYGASRIATVLHNRSSIAISLLICAISMIGIVVMRILAYAEYDHINNYHCVANSCDCYFYGNKASDSMSFQALCYEEYNKAECQKYLLTYIYYLPLLPRVSVICSDTLMAEPNHRVSNYFYRISGGN